MSSQLLTNLIVDSLDEVQDQTFVPGLVRAGVTAKPDSAGSHAFGGVRGEQ